MKNWQIAAGLAGLFIFMGGGMNLSDNFTLNELTATNTGLANKPGPEAVDNLKRLATSILQPIRDMWGPIRISSGYRSPAVNEAVKSTSLSQHLNGAAADIIPLTAPVETVFDWIRKESGLDFGQVIYEFDNQGRRIHISLPHTFRRNNEALLIIEGRTSYL